MVEKKDGEFAVFKKQGKSGKFYYNGSVKLGGKEYWVSVFENTDRNGSQYLSGNLKEKQPKQEEPKDDIPF